MNSYEHHLSSSENVAWKNKFSSQLACKLSW